MRRKITQWFEPERRFRAPWSHPHQKHRTDEEEGARRASEKGEGET